MLVVIISIFPFVFIFTMILLIKRKDYQPLKSRSVTLIFISTLGNFAFFLSLMFNKILQNNRWEIWDLIDEKTIPQ